MSRSAKVITIDGPSGVGKGTTSIGLSNYLGWHFLDSGAIYRALGWYANSLSISLDDLSTIAELIGKYSLEFVGEKILIDGIDVTAEVRHENCGSWASRIAVDPVIRAKLLESQKEFQKSPGLVADGRDMGTVVFPNAELKVFLIASAEERARRRYEQLRNLDPNVKLSELVDDIERRDERDTKRATSPLKAASDAVVIDTSSMSIDDVLNEVVSLARDAGIEKF